MCRTFAIIALLSLVAFAHAERSKSKTPLDLMLEGRYKEAQTILSNSKISPRYQLMFFALTEGDVARACSLYQVVAIRYPKSDCDSVARARMDQAQAMGFAVTPIAEWEDAPSAARPLELREVATPDTLQEPEPQAEVPTPSGEMISEEIVAAPDTLSTPAGEEIVEAVKETIEPAESPAVIPEGESVPSADVITESPTESESQIIEETVPEPEADVVQSETPPVEESETSESVAPPVPETVEEQPVPIDEPVAVALETETETSPQPEAEVEEKAETPAAEMSIPVPKVVPPISSETEPVSKEQEISKSPAPPERPASNGNWYIQVGAFGNFDNAHRLAKELQQAGFPVKLVMRENPGRNLLQVRVGGYSDRDATLPVKDRLKNEFGLPTALVSE